MPSPPPASPRNDPPIDPVRWVEGRTLDELDAIAYGATILVPDQLRFRLPKSAGGGVRNDPVLIRVPGIHDLVAARRDAIDYVRRAFKNPDILTMDDAVKAVGHTYFQQIDNYAIVALCTHERAQPGAGDELPQQFMLLDLFFKTYLGDVIEDVLDHMGLLKKIISPRFQKLTEGLFWDVCAAIATKGNLSPLGDMSEDTWQGYLVETSTRLWALRTQSFSSSSSKTSMPESSTPTS